MAEGTIEGASPTRMELLKVKNKLRLAEKGHRLLKERRDALMMEFMDLGRGAGAVVEEAESQLDSASRHFKYADALVGSAAVDSLSLAASERDLSLDLESRSVAGVKMPQISHPSLVRNPAERGFGLASTHPAVDQAALECETSLEKLIKLAEVESSLRSLSAETKRTKRRVSALEYSVIPRLKNTQKRIRMRLDELEREDFYRLKMFKSRKED